MVVSNTNGLILDNLDSTQVPVLPPGAPYLLKSLTDETISLKELAKIVERFPNIAARLITLANSVWSSPVTTITSLEMTCARLGFGIVRSVSLALAISSPFNSARCPAFDPERFWCSALLTADASAWLVSSFSTRSPLDPATARAAGLLHNLGLLWLSDQLPQELQQVFTISSQESNSQLEPLLQDKIGIGYCTASGRLGEAWELPKPLLVAMSEHNSPAYRGEFWETAAAIGIAASMVSALYHDTCWQPTDSRIDSLPLGPDAAQEVFNRLTKQFDRTKELARTLFS